MIRPAILADAPAICDIWNPLIRDTAITFNPLLKHPDEVAAMITSKAGAGHAFLVAEDAGSLAGFALTSPFRGGLGYRRTVEHTINLAPAARGRGLGHTLLAAIEAQAARQGMHSLWAGVSAENPQGVAFHESCGFTRVATLPQVGYKFERWIDLILLQKMLPTDTTSKDVNLVPYI